MTLTADAILERVRLRRRVTFWRIAALILVLGLIGVLGWRMSGAGTAIPHVAKVKISGVILDNDERHKLFEQVGKSGAEAVILEIESPGGGVTASEELYNDIRALSAKKPTVALVESMAASGGYLAALGADRIIAHRTSITGSIGVLVQYPNLTELLKTVGVTVESIKSSPLKASPNGVEPTSPEARAALQAVVMDSYAWFKGLVGERRKLEGTALDRVSDGRVFTGKQALEIGLIDQIGDEEAARAWLADEKKISKELPLREWDEKKNPFGEYGFAAWALGKGLEALGFPGLAERLRLASAGLDTARLDGLLAIWQPGENK